MPKVRFSVPHAIGQDQAAERLLGFFAQVKAQYGDQVSELTEEWGPNFGRFTFKTYGFAVKGRVEVIEESVELEGDLPFAAMMFKGEIERRLREQLTNLLS